MCTHSFRSVTALPGGRKSSQGGRSRIKRQTATSVRAPALSERHDGTRASSNKAPEKCTTSRVRFFAVFFPFPLTRKGEKNVMEETRARAHCVIAFLLRHVNRPRTHCVVNGRRVQRLRTSNSSGTVSVRAGRTCTANRASGSKRTRERSAVILGVISWVIATRERYLPPRARRANMGICARAVCMYTPHRVWSSLRCIFPNLFLPRALLLCAAGAVKARVMRPDIAVRSAAQMVGPRSSSRRSHLEVVTARL